MQLNSDLNIEWLNDNDFRIADTLFHASVDPSIYHNRVSDENGFLIVKTRDMINTIENLNCDISIKNILDIGVWQGGSIALIDCLYKPRRLVGLEYSKRELPHLDRYIKINNRNTAISIHKGINQADTRRVDEILDAEFGDQSIDLIIDDASHFLEETMSSFNSAFPRLAPNGIFLIEDWQWSTNDFHHKLDYFSGKPGLSNIIVMCMLVCGSRPDIISSVSVSSSQARIVRGKADLPRKGFKLSDFALNRGKPYSCAL